MIPKKAKKSKLKSKDIETWRVAELVAAKVRLEEQIAKGEWHGEELEKAMKHKQDLQDELNRRRRAGLL